jgi:hypothetical protein
MISTPVPQSYQKLFAATKKGKPTVASTCPFTCYVKR